MSIHPTHLLHLPTLGHPTHHELLRHVHTTRWWLLHVSRGCLRRRLTLRVCTHLLGARRVW